MPNTHVHVTEDHIGKVYVWRGQAVDLSNGRRHERESRYLIEGVRPAAAAYYRTQPGAGPRVEVTVRPLMRMRNGSLVASSRTRQVWLPTTGNERTIELEEGTRYTFR